MNRRHLILGLTAACLGLCLGAVPVRAEVPALDDGARRKRTAMLKSRADEWFRIHTRIFRECSRCRGSGEVSARTCPNCQGVERIVDGRWYMRVHHELRSPAFRAQRGSKADVTAAWRRYQPHGRTRPARIAFIESYELVDVRLVDATHGEVRVWVNRELTRPRAPKTFRFVWASERPGLPGKWFAYERRADGPWPDSGALQPYDGATDLGPGSLSVLAAGWPGMARHEIVHVHRRKKELIVTLLGRDGVPIHELKEGLGREALDMLERMFAHAGDWKQATVVAAGRWTSESGEVATKPYSVLAISSEAWSALKPANLQGFALLKALGDRPMSYWGWTHTR